LSGHAAAGNCAHFVRVRFVGFDAFVMRLAFVGFVAFDALVIFVADVLPPFFIPMGMGVGCIAGMGWRCIGGAAGGMGWRCIGGAAVGGMGLGAGMGWRCIGMGCRCIGGVPPRADIIGRTGGLISSCAPCVW
jgi:hypothetical protein